MGGAYSKNSKNKNLQNTSNPFIAQTKQQKQIQKKQSQNLKFEKCTSKDQQKNIESIKNQQKLRNTQKIFAKAQQLFIKKKLQESQILCNQCLEFQTQYPGKDSLEYAQTLHLLARIYFDRKQYDKALEFNIQSLDIKQKTIGRNHERYTATVNNMGLIYKNTQKLDQSLQCFQQCLQIEGKMRGENSQYYMTAVTNVGYVQMKKKNYNQALKYLLEYQKKYPNIKYKDQQEKAKHLIDTLDDIATCYSNLNENKICLEYRLKSLKAMENHGHTKSVKYANQLKDVGVMYSVNQYYQTSLQYYFRYLKLLEQLKQTKEESYTVIMCCIIQDYQRMQQLTDRTEKINLMCLKIIATCEATKDIDNQTYIYAIDYLGRNLNDAKQYKEALALFKKLQTILSIIDANLYQNQRQSTKNMIKIIQEQLK